MVLFLVGNPASFGVSASFYQCEALIRFQEKALGIPQNLLRAIGIIESGYHDPVSRQCIPWPWTIHVNGQGYYYPTKAQAIAAVKKFRRRGLRNMDVGCMQINLLHYAKAFRSLEEAFDPQLNIVYAAQFLKKLKKQYGDWIKAAGYYHSATPMHRYPYGKRVLTSLEKLMGLALKKQIVKEAVAGKKIETIPNHNTMVQFASLAEVEEDDIVEDTEILKNWENANKEQEFISIKATHHKPRFSVKVKYIALTQSRGRVFVPLG